jgi:hypothetical protein
MSEETNNEKDAIVETFNQEAEAVAELVEAYQEAVAEQAAKIEEAPVEEDAIVLPETTKTQPALAPVEGGVMGTAVIEKTEKKKTIKPKVDGETVALYSKRNISWTYIGELKKGYNIVPADKLDRWLTRDGVRIATPEEVAKEFGL